MEKVTPSPTGEENKCLTKGVKIYEETVDLERCESAELNADIRRQIQQKYMFPKVDEALHVSRTQSLYQRNLCHHEMLTQSQDLVESIREENCLLRKQNDLLYKRKEYYKNDRDHLSKVLMKATQKIDDGKPKTKLNHPARECDYEDLKAEIAALLQQIQIHEEDFRQERTDKEKLRKENEKLRQIKQRLRLQIQSDNTVRI
ncbi:TNFAIP3-interacting protein 3 [Pyxicephalus adspersus]|uniref:TNFAIP3-interacting protein 3 n=1 Tax=Pyxicephalus adspersus TaxID=30357 RepID=UPI003B5CF584